MTKRAPVAAAEPKIKTAGRYRKVEVRTWGDEKFRQLSPMPPCGQGLWLYLITGPHTGPIPGLFRASRAAMAEDLGWSLEAFDEAFREAFQQGMAEADFSARVMWIPNAIKHNKPESPNVVKSWAAEFDLVPECDLKRTAFEALKASIHALGEAFAKAFDNSFIKPSPKAIGKALPKPSPKAIGNQEQEQEQEQEYSEAKASGAVAPSGLHSDDREDPKPLTAKERVWMLGAPLLGENGRSLLGKLAREYGEELLVGVLTDATLDVPVEPKAWITAACEARRSARPRPNGNGKRHDEPVDICANPRPQWATDAGFDNRFEAENEGCLEHNAKNFRDGKRVAADRTYPEAQPSLVPPPPRRS